MAHTPPRRCCALGQQLRLQGLRWNWVALRQLQVVRHVGMLLQQRKRADMLCRALRALTGTANGGIVALPDCRVHESAIWVRNIHQCVMCVPQHTNESNNYEESAKKSQGGDGRKQRCFDRLCCCTQAVLASQWGSSWIFIIVEELFAIHSVYLESQSQDESKGDPEAQVRNQMDFRELAHQAKCAKPSAATETFSAKPLASENEHDTKYKLGDTKHVPLCLDKPVMNVCAP
mmetsp:Transcript_81151/g.148134  ORF Transcript_81151/g.148134 Transcript_81151/m.148134 type:complete len:232 (+) Transcript_81151:671-1366(+)